MHGFLMIYYVGCVVKKRGFNVGKIFEVVISPGDGIGHEIIGWVQKTLETISKIDGGFTFSFIPIEVGLGALTEKQERQYQWHLLMQCALRILLYWWPLRQLRYLKPFQIQSE